MALLYPISASQTDANSPVDQPLMDAIRLDLEDHEGRIGSNEALSSNDIRDDFKGTILDTDLWEHFSGGTPTVDGIGGSFSHTYTVAGNNSPDTVIIGGNDNKIRWDITHERVVVMEMRIRGTTTLAARAMMIGAQDSGLGALGSTYVTDVSDFIGVYAKNNGSWTVRNALAGVSSETVDVVSNAAWHTFKFVITCSATAGNRKIQIYLDGSEISGSPQTTNIPTVALRPLAGINVSANDGSTATFHIDYFLIYDEHRPEAA